MLERAKMEIAKQDVTVALVSSRCQLFTDAGKSVRPLYRLFRAVRPEFREGYVADRIIGKAAASIIVLAGAKEAFGYLMSESALDYLQRHGVKASYSILTPNIMNRAGTGLCPMEITVKELEDPEECVEAIGRFIATTPYPFKN